METRNRADAVAHPLHRLALDLFGRARDAGLQDQEAQRHLALQRVGDADHRALGNVGMAGQRLLDAAGREPMPGDVDDVVGPGHDVDIAVGVDETGVGGLVEAGEGAQIRGDEFIVGLP